MQFYVVASCLTSKMLLSKSGFSEEYHHSKPKKHDLIIVAGSCNNRNLDAVEALYKLGFTNIYSFVGGYDEWVRQYSSCGKTPSCDVSYTLHSRAPLVKMSTCSNQLTKTVGYEQVKNVDNNTILIDVREDKELAMTGTLPNSIHVPLGQIEDAFKNLPDEEFKEKYGILKPKSTDPLIFSCKAGIRSAKAVKIMECLGYKNLGNYEGGWDDWEAHQSK